MRNCSYLQDLWSKVIFEKTSPPHSYQRKCNIILKIRGNEEGLFSNDAQKKRKSTKVTKVKRKRGGIIVNLFALWSLWTKSCGVTFKMNALWHYFLILVLFVFRQIIMKFGRFDFGHTLLGVNDLFLLYGSTAKLRLFKLQLADFWNRPRGHCTIGAVEVCAAVKGIIFKQFSLEWVIIFQETVQYWLKILV